MTQYTHVNICMRVRKLGLVRPLYTIVCITVMG